MMTVKFSKSFEKMFPITATAATILAMSYRNLDALLRWTSFIAIKVKGGSIKIQALLFFFLFLILSTLAQAQTTVPHYLNFQSVVTDDGGNLVTAPFIDLEFQVLDGTGDLLYWERQESVQVVNGVINVMVGEGSVPGSSPKAPTGGIPPSALDPTEGTHSLRVKVGNNSWQEDLELLSTPYSIWAEKALSIVPNSIGSEEIKDGSIQLKDLEPGIAFSNLSGQATESQIPSTFTTDLELSDHLNSSTAHQAGQIVVTGPFISTTATTVEEVLVALDRKLNDFYLNQNELRESAIASLQGQFSTSSTTLTTLQNQLTQETADRQSADTETGLAIPPIGTIMPFYDFNGLVTFDTNHWRYCDGSVLNYPSSPLHGQTLPDLSNRYLVGFGNEGARDIGSAGWDTTAVGNAGHQIDLSHSHTVDIQSFPSSSDGLHGHTVNSHTHGVGTYQFVTASFLDLFGGVLVMYDASGNNISLNGSMSTDLASGYDRVVRWASLSGPAFQNFYTTNGAGTSAESSPGTNEQGAHSHMIDPPDTTSTTAGSTTPIQPRSIRVRYIIRVK